eukprot:5091806-Amphidinium_carterae.1
MQPVNNYGVEGVIEDVLENLHVCMARPKLALGKVARSKYMKRKSSVAETEGSKKRKSSFSVAEREGPKMSVLKVASACSGLGTESFALKALCVQHSMVMFCEQKKELRSFLKKAHEVVPSRVLKDVYNESFLSAGEGANLLVAGFP